MIEHNFSFPIVVNINLDSNIKITRARFALFCLIRLYSKGTSLVSHDIQEHMKIYNGFGNDCIYIYIKFYERMVSMKV